jgi:hypothetical protein
MQAHQMLADAMALLGGLDSEQAAECHRKAGWTVLRAA